MARTHRAGHQFAQLGGADADALPWPLEHRAGIHRRAARSGRNAGRADAALLIGDPGSARAPQGGCAAGQGRPARRLLLLRRRRRRQPVPGVDTLFVYDIAQQWREMTGKPCVLAVWVARRERDHARSRRGFSASREYGLSHIGEIAEGAALKLDLPPSELERYLTENIDFSLDAENLAGLRLYYRAMRRRRIDSARPANRIRRRRERRNVSAPDAQGDTLEESHGTFTTGSARPVPLR